MENDQINQVSEYESQPEKHVQAKKHAFSFILASFSIECTNHFNKVHKRRFHSFGDIHQLGKLPGAML